jgi:hypothetical protein
LHPSLERRSSLAIPGSALAGQKVHRTFCFFRLAQLSYGRVIDEDTR